MYPIVQWIVGVLIALTLPCMLITGAEVLPVSWATCYGLPIIGLLIGIAVSPVTTVTANKGRATLTIERRYLFFPTHRDYPFAEIADVRLVTVHSLGEGWTAYPPWWGVYFRIVVALTSGQVVRLPRIYSWDYRSHVKLAQRLGDFLNVPRG